MAIVEVPTNKCVNAYVNNLRVHCMRSAKLNSGALINDLKTHENEAELPHDSLGGKDEKNNTAKGERV